MEGNETHEQVRWLYYVVTSGKEKPFVSSEPSTEGDVSASYLSDHGITLDPWDIEGNSGELVPFTPLSRSITSNRPPCEIPFTEYVPPEDRSDTDDERWWSAQQCSGDTAQYFQQWALGSRRLPRRHNNLMSFSGINTITFPNPFLLSCPRMGWCPSGGYWNICFKLEPNQEKNESLLPHIAVVASQPTNARENSILYGELAVILAVMHSRVNQPKIESEEEMEHLFDMDRKEVEKIYQQSPAFPNEQKFPVLLFSFVGPQHARILCASMDQRQLIIRMSKLYSFEKEEEAPVELFTSWLFSSPVVET